MSSPANPVVSAAPHPSWYAKAASWLVGIAKAVKGGILKVASAEPKIDAALKTVAPSIEAISNLIIPGSGTIEAHLVDVWSVVASAVKGASDAASVNGLSVSFDAALIADVKAILPAVEAFLHPSANSTPAKP